MILFWGLLIFGVVALVRFMFIGGDNQSFRMQNREESARAILDQRYARGELSREEYEAMKHDLAR